MSLEKFDGVVFKSKLTAETMIWILLRSWISAKFLRNF